MGAAHGEPGAESRQVGSRAGPLAQRLPGIRLCQRDTAAGGDPHRAFGHVGLAILSTLSGRPAIEGRLVAHNPKIFAECYP